MDAHNSQGEVHYSGEDAKGPYALLSNRAETPFTVKDKLWKSVEHYFQAQKFAGDPHEEAIRNAKTVNAAHRMGRDRSHPLRKDWEEVKEVVAEEALTAKFQQHEAARTLLLSTGDARLVQDTRNDDYWGDSGKGQGQNKMGIILAKVRQAIREQGSQSSTTTTSS